MNSDIAEGKWKQLKGEVRKQWGKLTDDELDEIAGNREKFEGKMQERYGKSKDEAKEEWDRLTNKH
ncbi:CsbD family protein [Halioxenophilus aromaticivorans]|uniref:CsbD family protein n=1 Tax=Halioxenophilus aromaticivorans TaxID=1306992 RepID=A0AAV3TZ56_9ALTE